MKNKHIELDKEKVIRDLLAIYDHNLQKLIIETTKLGDRKALDLIFSLLWKLNEKALDTEIPQRLKAVSDSYTNIYKFSKVSFPKPIIDETVNRIWNALQDIGRLLNYQYLGDHRRKKIFEGFLEMSEVPLLILNHLAKSAIDSSLEKDYEYFVATIRALKLYENPDTDFRSRSLPNEILETREKLWKLRNTCFMGLGGWVIERFRDKTIEKGIALKMLGQLHIPFNSFLDVVFQPLDHPEESRFGWGDWDWKWGDREPRPGYDFRSRSGGPSWVYDYFIFEALKYWKRAEEWDVVKYEPPAKIGVHFLREDLERRLNAVVNDPFFIELIELKREDKEAALEKPVEVFKKYLERIEKTAEREEKEWIRNQEIDKSKYEVIKENFTKGFAENAIFRYILEKYHSAKVGRRKQEISEKLSPVYRVKDIRSHYFSGEDVAGFWKEIGESSAAHESIRIIRQLLKEQEPRILEGDAEEVIDHIESIIKEMKIQNLGPLVLILLGWVFHWRSELVLKRRKLYRETPEENKRFPEQSGTFHGVPIVRIWWGEQKPLLMLLAPKAVRLKNVRFGEGYKGIFKFRFNDLARDEEGNLTDEKAIKLLEEVEDIKTQHDKDEAILNIQQQFIVEIYEHFIVEAKPKGVRFFKVKVTENEAE